ncbi:hypothetical protein OA238_c29740 [Octadecabacter arcticus 238]|uniref:Uncharacterized protein n=1 Tax=Octadecabacter arcticus 238 TaxID=391616 RepID=M9RT60_9RHOB|nr:hypothetical protein [Octadecabacter arcticus]AGI72985.1 hypothetical protein OA238_c29740 [Octadecabacter arcticus 238]
MAKRTSLQDAANVEVADDIDDLVSDKRADRLATAAKGRRRQRRYKKRLTQELIRHLDDDAWGGVYETVKAANTWKHGLPIVRPNLSV